MSPSPPEAIFFDFDGVILESVDVKTEAFVELFADRGPEIQQAMLQHHLANPGVSRYEKFEYMFSKVIQEPLDRPAMDRLAARFGALVLAGVLNADFVPGALEFLDRHSANTACFVVSATPHDEIKRIVRERGLDEYFVSTHGSPRSKSSWAEDLLDVHSLDRDRSLFVGDALTDLSAARDNGIDFIGRVREGEDNPFPQDVPVIGDLTELERSMSELTFNR